MKQSDFFTKNGILFHPITPIIENAKQLAKSDILVICENDEVFDEGMITIMNRFPQALGTLSKPNAGCKMGKRNTKVSIYITQYGTTVNLHVVTKAEYTADQEAIDLHPYTSKHTISWSGGQN